MKKNEKLNLGHSKDWDTQKALRNLYAAGRTTWTRTLHQQFDKVSNTWAKEHGVRV